MALSRPRPEQLPQSVEMNMDSNSHSDAAATGSLQPVAGTAQAEFLTTADVADLLKKSRRTIELWARRGYLSSIKIGRSVFFERIQLVSDLRRYRVGPFSS